MFTWKLTGSTGRVASGSAATLAEAERVAEAARAATIAGGAKASDLLWSASDPAASDVTHCSVRRDERGAPVWRHEGRDYPADQFGDPLEVPASYVVDE